VVKITQSKIIWVIYAYITLKLIEQEVRVIRVKMTTFYVITLCNRGFGLIIPVLKQQIRLGVKTIMKKAIVIMSLFFALNVNAGDAEAGKTKSAMCASCHGADGNSTNPVWPKLAGQHEQYTARQLSLFKSGQRKATVMGGMVAGLSEADMQDLAAYFSSQKTNIGSSNPELLEVGKAIYQGGVKKLKIPACMACHGVAGKGNPLSGYPVLAGQHSAYTEQRLMAFKAGEVTADDDNGKIMADVAKYLSDAEIKALANYIQGLY